MHLIACPSCSISSIFRHVHHHIEQLTFLATAFRSSTQGSQVAHCPQAFQSQFIGAALDSGCCRRPCNTLARSRVRSARVHHLHRPFQPSCSHEKGTPACAHVREAFRARVAPLVADIPFQPAVANSLQHASASAAAAIQRWCVVSALVACFQGCSRAQR
jgi:hypothetical protein